MNIYRIVFLVDIQLANGNAFFIFKKIGVIDIERGLVSLDYFYGQAGELFSFYRLAAAAECSTPQNIKFAYSMEELMLQLAFYGGYTILAEPVLAQLPANKNLTFIPLENDTVPAWAVWNRENISPALQLLLRELDIDL